jgi:hypothetical protein
MWSLGQRVMAGRIDGGLTNDGKVILSAIEGV